jgi:hypothetical protein
MWQEMTNYCRVACPLFLSVEMKFWAGAEESLQEGKYEDYFHVTKKQTSEW